MEQPREQRYMAFAFANTFMARTERPIPWVPEEFFASVKDFAKPKTAHEKSLGPRVIEPLFRKSKLTIFFLYGTPVSTK